MKPSLINLIPSIEGEELVYLQMLTREIPEEKLIDFIALYNGKRRKPDQILLGCIIGFLGVSGVQRFMVRQTGMGLLFLFTLGFCWIGTIIDIINHRRLAFTFNQQMARESLAMISSY